MLTGRFLDATLRCAARGELPIQQAIEQALAHCPELWDRARADLERARDLMRPPRLGPAASEANQILAALAEAAGPNHHRGGPSDVRSAHVARDGADDDP